jgi:hypothetical protein
MDAVTAVGLWQVADLFCVNDAAYVKDSGVHINEPVTVELLIDAYTKGYSVSGYTADKDLNTYVGAIDFDKADMADIKAVRETMTKTGIPTLLAHSRRGAHLWVHVGGGKTLPAGVMNRALEQVIRLTNNSLLGKCEVFPKKSSSPYGVGALRLPLMTHPKTKVRYPCEDMDGNRLTKLIEVVSTIQYTPVHILKALAEQGPVEYPRGLGEYRKPTTIKNAGSAVDLLMGMGVQATPGHNARCPFHEDRHASMSVAEDDQRVWCKSPECIAYNGGRGLGTLALARMVKK